MKHKMDISEDHKKHNSDIPSLEELKNKNNLKNQALKNSELNKTNDENPITVSKSNESPKRIQKTEL